MVKNMGTIDRIARAIFVLILVGAYFFTKMPLIYGIGALVVGGVMAVTAAAGFCPMYLPFGIKTCKSEKKENQ